jgi:hypothetical protein
MSSGSASTKPCDGSCYTDHNSKDVNHLQNIGVLNEHKWEIHLNPQVPRLQSTDVGVRREIIECYVYIKPGLKKKLKGSWQQVLWYGL